MDGNKHLESIQKVRSPKRVPTGVAVLAFVGMIVWASYACIWLINGIEHGNKWLFTLGVVAAGGLVECIKRAG